MEGGAGEGNVQALSEQCFDGRVYKGLKQWQVLIFYTVGGFREAVCWKKIH